MKTLLIAFSALFSFQICVSQTIQKFEGIFICPKEVLLSSPEVDALSLAEAKFVGQSAFYKYAGKRKHSTIDTIFIGPYVIDGGFSPSIEAHRDTKFTFPDSIHILKGVSSTYWEQPGRYWKKCLGKNHEFGYDVYKMNMEGLVLGKWKYYFINPKAARRTKALIPTEVVVVKVTKFYKSETVNAEG